MPTLAFRPRHRLTHDRQFSGVYGARARATRGPLVLHALRNSLVHPRLGLSVGRRVGGAVARNRFKRLLREAFRMLQYDLPRWEGGCFDYVAGLHPHKELPLAEYRKLFLDLARDLAGRRAQQ